MSKRIIDINGQRFGRLVVLKRAGKNKKSGNALWLCKCDCGNEKVIMGSNLRSGDIVSCGCYNRDKNKERAGIVKTDLIGKRFDRLLVIEKVRKNNRLAWKCICDCGNIKITAGSDLRRGFTKSCGCLHKESCSVNGKLPRSKETLKKMSEVRIGKYTGKDSPHWKLDKTDEERSVGRAYREYSEWRKAVYERDSYTCQLCKEKSGNINAHHIESYNSNRRLRTTLSNGVTLCETCHMNFHHQYGKGDNTREQWEEFICLQ